MAPPDPEKDTATTASPANTDRPVPAVPTNANASANDENRHTTVPELPAEFQPVIPTPPPVPASARSTQSSESLESVSVSVVSDYRSVASVTAAGAAEAEAVEPEPVSEPVSVSEPVPAVTIDREPVAAARTHHSLSLPECLYGPLAHTATAAAAANVSPNDVFSVTPCPTLEQLQQQDTKNAHVISLPQLRKIAAAGIPDDDDCDNNNGMVSCRGVTWRVLLGMLPVETADWATTCQEKRQQYLDFCRDLFDEVEDVAERAPELKVHRRWRHAQQHAANDPSETSHTEDSPNDFVPVTESPDLSLSPQSERSCAPSHSQRPPQVLPVAVKDYWKKKGRDLHVLENLTRNMNALHLQESVHINNDNNGNNDNNNALEAALTVLDEREEPWQDFVESAVLLDEIRKDVVRTHPDLAFYLEPDKGPRRYAALERILFVWSKYNKGVRYVQGMNEIVGTIYYVLANDWNDEWADHAEADTYWLLNTLLSEMRDVFISDMDESDTGIQGRIANMHTLLGRHDPEVKEHLEDVGIETSFYAIRWWTTLLSREFLLPDIIRLWDSMFASTHKDNFLRYFCVTMVMVIREDLLKGDFSTCMRLLQGFPSTHMDHLVESSRALWIYESQLTLACHKGGISLHQALQTISPPPAIIMAFGVRDGMISPARPDPLEDAGEKVAATVRDATTAVATSAKGFFGRASSLYNKYSEEVKTRYRTASADGANDINKQDATSSVSESKSADDSVIDSIYLDAINKA
jgi:hypothetical protein